MEYFKRASQVRLMGFDIDGVMTDGGLYYSSSGDCCKAFFSCDGLGLRLLAQSGIKLAIITGRDAPSVSARAANLGIDLVLQGVLDKRTAMANLLDEVGYNFSQAGYMGDDLIDLPLLKACAFSASVPNGHRLVRNQVDHVTQAEGGKGAVREVCELLLQAQGNWERIMAPYIN